MKLNIGVTAASLMLAAGTIAEAQNYSNAVMALNPAAYWPLQETAAPSGGLYIATNSGTLGAAGQGYYATWWATNSSGAFVSSNTIVHIPGAIAGDSDTALQQGVIGQYVVIPRTTNGVANPAVTLTAPFTIETWIYPTNAASGLLKPILAEGFNNVLVPSLNYNKQLDGTAIGMYSGFLYFVTFNGAAKKTEIDTGTLVLNQWHHVVATFDGTTMHLYLDGAEIGSGLTPPVANGFNYVPDQVSPLIVGGGNELGVSGGANVPFGGGIDEVALYNQALTVSQVTNHYATGTNSARTTPYAQVVQSDSPTIYLRLDEPAFGGAGAINSYPVANSYGSLGVSANGYYLPGTTPGVTGPSYSGFGTAKNAVALNGFNAAIDIGNGSLPAALNPTGHQPLSVLAWFKGNPSDAVGRFQSIVGHGDPSWRVNLDNNAGVQFNPGAGPQLQFANVQDELTNGFFVNDGNWHFVAAVSDGTNDAMYIDGALAKSGTAAGSVTGLPLDLLLGSDPQYTAPQPPGAGSPAGGGRAFDGSLAHIAFFTNVLSAAQIQQLFTVAAVPLTAYSQPQSVTNNAGTVATLTFGVRGSSPAYQWYSTNVNTGTVSPVAGQTNASLVFNPVALGNAGYYFAVATNGFSSVTSSVAQLSVVGPPVITQQSLTDVRVFVGTTPTLQLTVDGPSPMYQWSSNSVAIAGATNSSYTLNTGNTSSAGASTYHCVVTNNFGSATGTFSVTVLASPTAPYSQSVLASQPVAYFRLAEPDNGSGNNGVTAYDNAGGYNGSYTNAVLSQPGYSTTDPSDTAALFGQLTGSDSYAGNVPSYLSFAQPSGHNAEFSVEAWFISQFSPQPGFESGLVTIGYGNGGEQFSIDFGANQTTFPLRFYLRDASGTAHGINTSFVPHGDGKWHHVVAVCDEAGGHLYVYIDGFLNSSITIAAGAGLFGWTTPLTIGSRLTSQTSAYANQFFGDVDQVALYNYALSAAQVQAHYLSAGIAPVITSIQPSTLTTNQGSTASFTVAAAGTAPLFYQWSDPTSTAIPNATNATLVLNNVQPGQAGTYTVTVTNVYGSANTNATLTVVQGPPEITQDLQPTSLTVFAGSPIIYTIVVAGSPPFSYQWYQDGLKVNGATNSSYSFLALLGTHTYFCQVTNIASGGTPTVSSTGTVVGMASTTLNPANYTDKLKITFSGYNRSTALADFPALVRLSTNISGFNYGHFASPTGGDLRFTDSSGTRVIPSEIDQWNPNGESVVWVQMPRLSSTNDSIWAYWGNPGATTPPPGTNVWIPQPWEGLPAFDMVYHLKESGFPYADSTGQYAASAGIAPTPSTGLVGLGQTFASAAHLDAGSVNLGNTLSNAFTLSAWVNLSPTANSIQTVWANGPGGFTSAGFRFYVNNWNTANGAVVLEVANGSAGSQVNTSGGLVGANQWHMVAATLDHDNGVAQLYVDGVAQVSGTVRNDFPTNNPDLALANLANNDNAFPLNGMMDEARVQSGVSSPDWIWASYQTVAANGSLQSYGGVNSSVVTMKFHVSGGNIILSGVGPAGMSYDLLSSTNLSSQTATWPSIASGTFDSQGNFSVTNPISSNKKSQFFRLRVP